MRYIVFVVSMAFMASLFVVSQGFAAGEIEGDTGYGKAPAFGSAAEFGEDEQHGMTGQKQDTSGQQQAMAGQQLTSNQIKELQRILNEEGYDAGPVDGIYGPMTKTALQNFQQFEGLAATGQPTEDTLRALAPDAETQEMFGLSPEFGEQDQQQWQEEQQPMDQQMNQQPVEPMEEEWTPEGSESMDRY